MISRWLLTLTQIHLLMGIVWEVECVLECIPKEVEMDGFIRNCMESKFCSHQNLGLAINSISRVVELKLTWDQCPKFTNWVVQLLLVLHFCLLWVHLGPWAGSLTLGPARVCYAMQNVFGHKWGLGNDLGRFQVPTCMWYHKFMIWRRWEFISKYFLVRMPPHSRSEFIIRFY